MRVNKALMKIIRDYEIDCPNKCGKRILKGDTLSHLKVCPEQLIECSECDKKLKRDQFEEHIAKEHRDLMIEKFALKKPGSKTDEDTEEVSQMRRNGNRYIMNRNIPVGWG